MLESCVPVTRLTLAIRNVALYFVQLRIAKVKRNLVCSLNSTSFRELTKEEEKSDKMQISMVGFVLKNTLSENGGVTRGVCRVDENQMLTKIVETSNIVKTETGAAVLADGKEEIINADTPVSMNMWGLTPEFFGILESGFAEFLDKQRSRQSERRISASDHYRRSSGKRSGFGKSVKIP